MDKLIKIQTELKAPKDKYNSFGKYKYRSAESILEAVKPLCEKYGCLLTLSDEVVNIGDRYYVKATAVLRTPKAQFNVTAYAREDETKKGMDGSQISGTASSYARKYALNGLFCIDDTKDADTDEYHNQTNQPAEQPVEQGEDPKHAELVQRVKDKADKKKIPMTEILRRGGVAKLEDMPSAQLQACINWMGR